MIKNDIYLLTAAFWISAICRAKFVWAGGKTSQCQHDNC